jgi:hypothetical protein
VFSFAHHGLFELDGIGLLANLIGFIIGGVAVTGICRARRTKAVTLSLAFALVGLIIVICGTTLVVASE